MKQFKPLPGSARQRNRARNILKCVECKDGWNIYGGRELHLVEKVGTELVCDCNIFDKTGICSHIIKVQMELNTFPERGRYPA